MSSEFINDIKYLKIVRAGVGELFIFNITCAVPRFEPNEQERMNNDITSDVGLKNE